ncbi:MAG: MopE-related protein [bacterium]
MRYLVALALVLVACDDGGGGGGATAGQRDGTLPPPILDAGGAGGVGGGAGGAGGGAGGGEVPLTGCGEEVCDAADNDCDGQVDEVGCACDPGAPGACYGGPPGTRGVGICRDGTRGCDDTGEFFGLCEGWGGPGFEVCNGEDDDCDATADEDCADCQGAAEQCANGADDDCDGFVDEGCTVCGEAERCDDGVDDDCDGQVDEGCGCRGEEICGNQLDDDCDLVVDESCLECELDDSCAECDPAETCNDGIDNDCNGLIDDGCDDPCQLREVCGNEADEDCDGQVDEGLAQACYTFDPATENVGRCRGGARQCVNGQFGDCEGQVGPSPELCNDRDDDCDGRIDQFTEDCFGEAGQGLDPALIGRGLCEAGFRTCRDGVVGECVGDILPEAEICDRLDNDCDGSADEDFDFVNDPANCRECGRRCNAGEGCCASACRPLNTPENCGACGRTCGDDSDRCAAGAGGAECRCGNGPACEDGGAGLTEETCRINKPTRFYPPDRTGCPRTSD